MAVLANASHDGCESPEFDLPLVDDLSEGEADSMSRPSKRAKRGTNERDTLDEEEALAIRMLRG
jgi:hypothetical protein